MRRRTFVKTMAGASAASLLPGLLPPSWWRSFVFAATPARPGASPYGPLLPPDDNGIELPDGFTSRVIATTGRPVAGTSHIWHSAPDGGGCVDDPRGGWVYTSNAELENDTGGVSAIRFDADGSIVDAYPILTGTSRNCAGGMTPWRTWLSCEERGPTGKVYECDPFRRSEGIVRPLLGSFNHEAAAVDPATGDVYLTEDHPEGRLYRFVPDAPGDLTAGTLLAAAVDGDGSVGWMSTSTRIPDRRRATTPFAGGEGVHIGDGVVYFATKIDKRIWELDLATSMLSVAYDCLAHPEGSLNAVDNVTIHAPTGRVLVAEDGGNMEVGLMAGSGADRTVSALLRIQGQRSSEVAGIAFSPDGTRLYFSSQRGIDQDTGITYEITGPFGAATDGNRTVALSITSAAHVRGGSHAADNFADRQQLQICSNADDQYVRRAFIAVPITTARGPYTEAVLRLTARVWNGVPSQIDVLPAPADWDPATLTWDTQPTPLGGPIASFGITSDTDERYEVDVTGHLNRLHADGATVAAFTLRHAQPNGPVAYVTAPAANSNRPELVLTSDPEPAPPAERRGPPGRVPRRRVR
ncbi:MAG: DUF839 domain-containing protein [Ilumatobacter sp.]|nr:DUF839 domain-containing protein [Ilumatobacter sp.]